MSQEKLVLCPEKEVLPLLIKKSISSVNRCHCSNAIVDVDVSPGDEWTEKRTWKNTYLSLIKKNGSKDTWLTWCSFACAHWSSLIARQRIALRMTDIFPEIGYCFFRKWTKAKICGDFYRKAAFLRYLSKSMLDWTVCCGKFILIGVLRVIKYTRVICNVMCATIAINFSHECSIISHICIC